MVFDIMTGGSRWGDGTQMLDLFETPVTATPPTEDSKTLNSSIML